MEAFLTYLAVEGHVAPSTQNQALNSKREHWRRLLSLTLSSTSDGRGERQQREKNAPPRGQLGPRLFHGVRDSETFSQTVAGAHQKMGHPTVFLADRIGPLPSESQSPH